MIKPTIFTWILALFGVVTFLPLIGVQVLMLFRPSAEKTKELIIGKGEEWRDRTHYKSALGFAWADVLVLLPLFVVGTTAVLSGHLWGYTLWFAMGCLSIPAVKWNMKLLPKKSKPCALQSQETNWTITSSMAQRRKKLS